MIEELSIDYKWRSTPQYPIPETLFAMKAESATAADCERCSIHNLHYAESVFICQSSHLQYTCYDWTPASLDLAAVVANTHIICKRRRVPLGHDDSLTSSVAVSSSWMTLAVTSYTVVALASCLHQQLSGWPADRRPACIQTTQPLSSRQRRIDLRATRHPTDLTDGVVSHLPLGRRNGREMDWQRHGHDARTCSLSITADTFASVLWCDDKHHYNYHCRLPPHSLMNRATKRLIKTLFFVVCVLNGTRCHQA